MHPRLLGRTDLAIPPLVFGTMARRQADDATREQLIRAAVDRGLTALDTAPLYDFGRCETQIGRALRGIPRDRVQLLTKVGLRWHGGAHGRVLFAFDDAQGRRVEVRKDSRPDSLRWEVEQSLQRLQVESLDLVQVHHPDVDTPMAETMGALLDLKAQGKLRYIGVSNFSAEQVLAAQAALGDEPLCSLQSDYSLLRRELESELLPLCREQCIGVLAYSPLGVGILAGRLPKIDDSAAMRRLQQAFRTTLSPIADVHSCSPAAVALAWLLAQPGLTAAIAGASSVEQLDTQLDAIALELAPGEVAELSQAFANLNWPASWEQSQGRVSRWLRRARRLGGRALRSVGIDPSKRLQ